MSAVIKLSPRVKRALGYELSMILLLIMLDMLICKRDPDSIEIQMIIATINYIKIRI